MRRRKVIIGILALVLCGILAVALWPEAERPEPIYNGRKLSQWAQSFGTNGAQREAAIRAIGTNGIPFYLEWVSYKPSLLKRARIEIAARTRSWLPFEWSPGAPADNRELVAFLAFEELGERAAPAIPQLVTCVREAATGDSGSTHVAVTAMGILANMGAPAVPAVLSLMTNENAKVRAYALYLAGRYSKDPTVGAQIQKSLQDPDAVVRHSATLASREYEKQAAAPMGKP